MIRAEFSRSDNGKISLTMKGHSTYKEKGQLLVCAGISTLLYTLIGYLRNSFGCRLRIFRLAPGDVEIECTDLGEEAFRMACIGFLQLGESYPGEISVINNVWDSRLCLTPIFGVGDFDFEEKAYE